MLNQQTAPFPFRILQTCLTIFFFCVYAALSLPIPALAKEDQTSIIRPLVVNGSVLLQSQNDTPVAINIRRKYIPASIWKIATASSALALLGADYRFKTEIYQTRTGDLFIKGYGDPFLVSEEIDVITRELRDKMRLPPGNIYVDQSFFALPGLADGAGTTTNPYDAGNFALSVNFNTLNLRKSKTGKIISAEPQTPDLAVMQLFAKSVGNGPTRLNISPKEGVVSRYAAELFHAKINNGPAAKHPNPPRVFQSLTPSGASLIHTHYSSKTLLEVIEEMLLYSNNFIANQIFLTCGALQYSAPATWEKGREAMRRFLAEEVALPTDSFNVEEGSGLSLKNQVTAEAMATLLLGYAPYSHTLPKHKGIHVKSGTLTGAYSYAGYFERGAEKFPFVIMLNQKQNHRDKILAALKKSYVSGERADQAFR